MSKKQITLDEKRAVQLNMLQEVDKFCRNNNIRYSLAFGTLLGAVRHKGFIPWDDDMDIMMPMPDLERFRQEFSSENVRYIDVNNEKHYPFPFPDIVDTHTYSKRGLIAKGWGIDINLYPIKGLPNTKEEIDKYYASADKILKKRLFINSLRYRMIQWFPINDIPLNTYFNKKYAKFCNQYPYEGTKYYLVHASNLSWRFTYDLDLFEELIDVPFENYTFLAIAKYDRLLTQMYGDYMTPPPIEERVPYHGGEFYWK